MALGSTQPLTEMSSRNLPGRAVGGKADNLTAICEPTVYKMWEHRHLMTLWASAACYMDSSTFLPENGTGVTRCSDGPEDRNSIPGGNKNLFSSPQRPDRVCGPPSLL
jgi:hypothetical protein